MPFPLLPVLIAAGAGLMGSRAADTARTQADEAKKAAAEKKQAYDLAEPQIKSGVQAGDPDKVLKLGQSLGLDDNVLGALVTSAYSSREGRMMLGQQFGVDMPQPSISDDTMKYLVAHNSGPQQPQAAAEPSQWDPNYQPTRIDPQTWQPIGRAQPSTTAAASVTAPAPAPAMGQTIGRPRPALPGAGGLTSTTLAPTPSGSMSMTDAATGMTFTKQIPGTTNEQITEALYSEASAGKLPPLAIPRLITEANYKRLQTWEAGGRKGPLPAMIKEDPQRQKTYENQYWMEEYGRKLGRLTTQNPTGTIQMMQAAAAQQTFAELGYAPDDPTMRALSGATPEQITKGTTARVMQRLNDRLTAAIDLAATPGPAQRAIATTRIKDKAIRDEWANRLADIGQPNWLGREVDAEPGLTLDEKSNLKRSYAGQLAISMARQYTEAGETPQMALYHGIRDAGVATGGLVPQEFHPIVGQNPQQALGLSDLEWQLYGTNPYDPAKNPSGYNPYLPKGRQELADAAADASLRGELIKQAVQAIKEPDVAAQAAVGGRGALTQAGPAQRAIEAGQAGAVKREQEQAQREFSIAPTSEIDKIKPLDDLYVIGVRLQQLVTAKTSGGQSMLDKYGDMPAFAFSTTTAFKKQFGSLPDDVAKYIALLGKVFNVEKKTFAGTATSLNERSDLLAFMPDPKDNLRTAIQKLNTLVNLTGSEISRDLEYLQKNYPKTDISAFNFDKIRQARKKAQEGK